MCERMPVGKYASLHSAWLKHDALRAWLVYREYRAMNEFSNLRNHWYTIEFILKYCYCFLLAANVFNNSHTYAPFIFRSVRNGTSFQTWFRIYIYSWGIIERIKEFVGSLDSFFDVLNDNNLFAPGTFLLGHIVNKWYCRFYPPTSVVANDTTTVEIFIFAIHKRIRHFSFSLIW